MIDALASRPHYAAHIAPVWQAMELETSETDAFWTSTPEAGLELDGWGIPALPLPSSAHIARYNRIGAPPVIVASSPDAGLARRHRFRYLVRMEHGAGQSYSNHHPAYAGGSGQRDVALFLCPNAHSAARWQRAYPDADVAIVGSPFAETLPPPDRGASRVGLTFHFSSPLWPELRSAVRHYAPALADLARRFDVLGHHHPRATDVAEVYAEAGIEVETDYRAWLRRCLVIAGDNTSALFEAALTRPVVVLDAPWYRRDVRHGLRFWEAADVGVRIGDPADLDAAIERAIADPPEIRAIRDIALEAVYAHRTGAARRAADAIRATIARVNDAAGHPLRGRRRGRPTASARS